MKISNPDESDRIFTGKLDFSLFSLPDLVGEGVYIPRSGRYIIW
jgi:hypothetical protein